MGEKMNRKPLTFVSFDPKQQGFVAFISLEGFLASEEDIEPVIHGAAVVYGCAISRMRSIVADINSLRRVRKLTPARLIWRLGDEIFRLTENFTTAGLQMDKLYDHLERDLSVKRKWLEKVIIFRRHVPKINLIPEDLNWGRCEKGTRKAAERIVNGLPV